MSSSGTFQWHGGQLVRDSPAETRSTAQGRLLVADSWLVDEGTALALPLHRRRFLDACAEIAPHTELDTEAFWDAATGMIPSHGAWFPRVELVDAPGGLAHALRVRPAPQREESIVLATHAGPDPRTVPRTKGPDLERLSRIRAGARERGIGDVVILSPGGHIIEGAATAIVWWNHDTLCVPPAHLERVDSVTARMLVAVASDAGVTVREHAAAPHELDGLEVWALNALHGIRVVTDWKDGPAVSQVPGRGEAWRARLRVLRTTREARA